MNDRPANHQGLTHDAALGVGNNIYAVLLGLFVAAVTVQLIGQASPNAQGESSRLTLLLQLFPVFLYYLLDWYDLNIVTFIDPRFDRKQMALYVLSVIIQAAVIAGFAAPGKEDTVIVLSSTHLALALLLRDRLLDLPKASRNVGHYMGYGAWRILLIIGIIAGLPLTLLPLDDQLPSLAQFLNWTPSAPIKRAFIVLLWTCGFGHKLYRSRKFLDPLYAKALKEIDGQNRRMDQAYAFLIETSELQQAIDSRARDNS